VTQRNGILVSSKGFSLAGTLVAVAIGAIVATLVATVITQAVKGQRSVIDRDEMSEFSLHLKGLLTNDSSCVRVLREHPFPEGSGQQDLSFNETYQDQPGPIQRDFEFSNRTLRVTNLVMEDKRIPAVTLRIPVTGPDGAISMVNVKRLMARIRLDVQHINGTTYRPRFFEIPVYTYADGPSIGLIQGCNNEFSIADACSALGFEHDPNPDPSNSEFPCRPSKACYAGGTFVTGCGFGNRPHPSTGTYSCPAGHTAFPAGATNIRALSCGKYCCYATACVVTHCMVCPSAGGSGSGTGTTNPFSGGLIDSGTSTEPAPPSDDSGGPAE